jgi:2-amino-4-hydroxy-6-hydroxymethyldihydropteridine diphosphokinase
MARACIGLGSNLDDPGQQLCQAIASLRNSAGIQVIALSSLYLSAPMGPKDQPDYVNAVAELETELEPLALLDALQAIENAQGRVRDVRWGPRTLDLDILLYDDLCLDDERLSIPHPGLLQRNFVLYPLAEIAPDRVLPDGRRCREVAEQQSKQGLERLNEQCA